MTRASVALLLASIAAAGAAACAPGEKPGWEYMPDMARGPGYKAFAPNSAMHNGITLQRPVPGTIARGYQPFHYDKSEADAQRASQELVNPFRATPQIVEKGKALYQIYCLVCHGEQGKGDGPLSGKIPPPPSYKTERLLGFAPGRLFHVITVGANRMPSYAAQLSPEDRWLVITYIRSTLQGLPDAEGPGSTSPGPIPVPNKPGAGGTLAQTTPAADAGGSK